MKIGLIIALLAGVACAIGVVAYFGYADILRAATTVGWAGFAILCMYFLLIYLPLGGAWRALVRDKGVRLEGFMWGRLIRDAATELLPFSSIGGFVLGARAAMHSRLSASLAFASSLVDLTTELFAQIAFILLGAGFWMVRLAHGASDNGLTFGVGAGLVVFVIGGLGFFAVQRRGVLRWAAHGLSRFVPGLEQSTEEFHARLEAIYEDRGALFWSSALHLVGWIASAIGVWIALRFIRIETDVFSVIAIEALICALRSLAFFVPSAIGVQEAGYALIAPLFGVPADAGIAISLLKRAREIATGVIALVLWQVLESRRMLRGAVRHD